MLPLCGDIEENPSLVVDGCDRVNFGSSQNGDLMSLLQNRLHELGLEAVDCGGSGEVLVIKCLVLL